MPMDSREVLLFIIYIFLSDYVLRQPWKKIKRCINQTEEGCKIVYEFDTPPIVPYNVNYKIKLKKIWYSFLVTRIAKSVEFNVVSLLETY